MVTTSDELTAPLGIARPATTGRAWRYVSAGLVGTCAALLLAGALYIALFGDPMGGRPHVRVDIAPARAVTALPDPVEPARPKDPAGDPTRSNADAVEGASGVVVTRPDGAGAPSSLIVRVPDPPSEAARPASEARLVERTRFGPLPKVGSDGTKPLDVYARPAATELPGSVRPVARVAIVVGGLGISQTATAEALAKLSPDITFAFAPYGPDLEAVTARARATGHELMLQVPMEPFDYPDSDPGPHTMTAAAKPAENIDHLQWAMGRLTGYVGVMNYMGGKLTSDGAALAPILKEIGARGLAFLDDGSSSRSLAATSAGTTRVARAAVLLDASPRADLVDKALEKLEASAVSTGFAVGTATALPVSIDRIARWSRGLADRGILLVPASYAFRQKPGPKPAAPTTASVR